MNKFQGSVEKKIAEIAAPVIGARDAFLIDIAVRGSNQGRAIEIFIDNETGVTTELCASVSREIGKCLDDEGVLRGRYYLVVSSPGTDRPLVFPRQYRKHIDRSLSVRFRDESGIRMLKGKLKEVTDISVTISEDNGDEHLIHFDMIDEAKVLTII